MKKYYLILLIITGIANAQTVNIPDPNFKAALLAQSVDTNGDGEIQVSEAVAKIGLNVSNSNIVNLTGIEAFVNLEFLNCSANEIITLDLTALTNLQSFYGMNNPLTSLNITGLESLSSADIDHCALASIDLTGCTVLDDLDLSYNQLTFLDVSPAINLTSLTVSFNFNLQTLTLAGATNLSVMHATNTSLSSFDLSGSSSLTLLDLSWNTLGAVDVSNCGSLNTLIINGSGSVLESLNVSGCTSLELLEVNADGLTELDISNLPNLSIANVSNSGIITLNASGCSELSTLDASNCELTSIDVSGCTNLLWLEVPYNQLTTLDASTCHSLISLNLDENPLETLFIKNGSNENIMATISPLVYICADESQLQAVAQEFSAIPNVVINSYCSFTPGGDYNIITGIVSFDANNNGPDASDPAFPFNKVTISGPPGDGATFTDVSGSYAFYTQAGNYEVMPQIENENFFNLFTPVEVNFPVVNNSVITQNFSIVANGIHPDVEVVIVPLVPAQPGFDAVYKIVYKNKGNQLLSGEVLFEFGNMSMEYLSAVPPPDNILSGSLEFEYADMMPFENREIIVTLNINAPTDTPPVNIGDLFDFTAQITINEGSDENPADNIFLYNEAVIGSYDPNNKICSEGEVVGTDNIGGYLHYVINFENTGTAPAQNVVVRDTIDPLQFDVSSVQVMNASHPVVARQNGNILECIFEEINLDSGGHGNILLKIKTLNTLQEGEMVTNKADIFFDYNFPVTTENANTTFATLSIYESELGSKVLIAPNPVDDILQIRNSNEIEAIELYDIQGRLLEEMKVNSKLFELTMGGRQTGFYLLKVRSSLGQTTHQILKK
ncbi:MAG: T9SS type A sorting domain-containing protein [Flavobacterium sp.]|nr:T9SS type A sorting domain-containing protein [Flavobacterium sp.]